MHPFTINYLFFSIIVILLLLSRKFQLKHEAVDYIFIVFSFIIFNLLHVGVDINSVEDLPNYKELFQKVSTSNFLHFYEEILTTDYCYAFINKCVSYFSDDFLFLLLLYNLFLFYSHYNIIIKYSPFVPLSIVLMLLLVYNQSLFVLRQYLANSIILFSIPCIFKRQLFQYLLICLIAVFTHSSSLVWIPVYFIYNCKNRKSFVLGLVITTLSYAVISLFIIQYMSLVHLEFGRYVDKSASTAIATIIIRLTYLMSYVIILKKHIYDDGINRLCFIALYLILIGYIFAPPIEMMSRVLQYYMTLMILSIPITMYYMKSIVVRAFFIISILLIEGILVSRGLNEFYFAYYSYDGVSFGYMLAILAFSFLIFRKYKHYNNRIVTK